MKTPARKHGGFVLVDTTPSCDVCLCWSMNSRTGTHSVHPCAVVFKRETLPPSGFIFLALRSQWVVGSLLVQDTPTFDATFWGKKLRLVHV